MEAEATKGSGVTTRELMSKLRERVVKGYQAELMMAALKPSQREAALSGFRDGMRIMLQHLIGMGVVSYIEKGGE